MSTPLATFTGEIHPAAALFPMISDADLDQMAADIRERGLVHPLVLTTGGVLLDGRNRLEACARAGVEPRWTTYRGEDPTRYVMSVNLERRHLSEDERAFLALELIPMFEEEARRRVGGRPRMEEVGPRLFEQEEEKPSANRHEVSPADRRSTAQAAKAVKVSGRNVARAKRVAEQAPDLVEDVKRGRVSMSKAESIAKARASGLRDEDRDSWFTPTWLFEQIGLRFNLDVCAPQNADHRTCPAASYLTVVEDGLETPWVGTVWCNPPYSTPEAWADKMIAHGNGILLVHMPNNAQWMVRAQRAASSVRLIQSMEFMRPNGTSQRPGYSLMLATYGAHLRDALVNVDGEKVGPLWRA